MLFGEMMKSILLNCVCISKIFLLSILGFLLLPIVFFVSFVENNDQ